jgi:hypothetical protein
VLFLFACLKASAISLSCLCQTSLAILLRLEVYPLRSAVRRIDLVLRSVDLVGGGLSSPLLCAPARWSAHLFGCSASPRLTACVAAGVGAPLDSSLCTPSACTSGAGVPTRGTCHWGHPLRVERVEVTAYSFTPPVGGCLCEGGPRPFRSRR